MVTSFQPKSIPWHRLTRFVTKKAVALLLKVNPDDIHEIRRWPFVLLVVGKNMSCFVSYADMPIVPGVGLPDIRDFQYWHRRWKGSNVPQFWIEFYAQQFQGAVSKAELFNWGQMVKIVKPVLPPQKVEWLRRVYIETKNRWDSLMQESNRKYLYF